MKNDSIIGDIITYDGKDYVVKFDKVQSTTGGRVVKLMPVVENHEPEYDSKFKYFFIQQIFNSCGVNVCVSEYKKTSKKIFCKITSNFINITALLKNLKLINDGEWNIVPLSKDSITLSGRSWHKINQDGDLKTRSWYNTATNYDYDSWRNNNE